MIVLDLKDKAKWTANSINFNSTAKINKKGYFYSFLDNPGKYEARVMSRNISGNGLFYIKIINKDKKIVFSKTIKFTSKSWSETIFSFEIKEIWGKCKFLVTRDLDGIGRLEIGRLIVDGEKLTKAKILKKEKSLSRDELILCSPSVKTAIIVPYGIYGGAEVYLKNIFKHEPIELDVEFLFLKRNKLISYIQNYKYLVLGSLNKLKHKLITESYKKIVFYNSKMIYSLILDLKKQNLINADLTEIYHSDFKWSDSLSSLQKREEVYKIIRVSDSLCNNISGDFKLKTIPVSIDVDLYSKKETKLKDIAKFNAHEKIFGLVARLSPEKNIDYAIRLFEHLPNYKLIIVGDGPLRSHLQSEIESRKIKNIELIGYKENVFEYYNLFDAFLLTSKFEGTPISIIEAMAYNIPIFTTDVGEIRYNFESLNGINFLTQNIQDDIKIINSGFNADSFKLREYVLNNYNSKINSKNFFEEISGGSLSYKVVNDSEDLLVGEYF